MRTVKALYSNLSLRRVRTGPHQNRSGSVLPAVLVAGAILLAPGGVFRAAAAYTFDYDCAGPTACEETITTLGVVRVYVDPAFVFLMKEDIGLNPYPGWNGDAKTITTPALSDFNTRIVRSAAYSRNSAVNPIPLLDSQSITRYTDYMGWPDGDYDFQYKALDARRELLTEIKLFTLTTFSNCYGLDDPRSSSDFPVDIDIVRAGYANDYNNKGSITEPNYLLPSIGMVQADNNSGVAANDFVDQDLNPLNPGANSFFDVYTEITLPRINGTRSLTMFPFYGAVLTNADLVFSDGTRAPQPLIVKSVELPGPLPPTVVYSHTPSSATADQQFGVPLRFKYDSDPAGYWKAGDLFGTVILAGHGTKVHPCDLAKTYAVETFLDAVLGPIGQTAQSMIVPRLFPNTLFPSLNSAYGSAKGTNFGGGSIDAVRFTNGPTVLSARNFTLAGLTSPIALPAVSNSVVYSNTSAVLSFEVSIDATNFYPALGTGLVQVLIVNTNPGTAHTTRYYTELTAMNISGSSDFGVFKLRESPTKASPGKHIVQSAPVGYRIGGDFYVSLEYSFNNGVSYKPADRPIWFEQEALVDCGAEPAMLKAAMVGSVVTITWNSPNYRLLGATSLAQPITWVDLGIESPYVFSLPATYKFFRLVCP